MWEACLETVGEDIGESVTEGAMGDYIVRAISLVIAMGGMNAGFAEKKIMATRLMGDPLTSFETTG